MITGKRPILPFGGVKILTWGPVLFWVPVLLGLYFISLHNPILFHSLAEIFSVVLAVLIFAIAWNSRRVLENNYLLFLGMAFLYVGLFDLIHALSFRGMGVFSSFEPNLSRQLWIAARVLESLSLLLAPLFLHRRMSLGNVLAGYSLLSLLVLLSIFPGQIFPDCSQNGIGLTSFRQLCEYLICLILVGAMASLLKVHRDFDRKVLHLLSWAILLSLASELAFAFYASFYGDPNLIGHLLKILAFYLIYQALIETGLVKPYDLIFQNLQHSEASLRQRQKELEAANQELEGFSYSVSHDLRAPLRSISGFSRILEEKCADRLDARGLEYLRWIREGAQEMNRLIDALLNLSHMVLAEMTAEPVNLSALAASLAADLQGAEPQRRVEFVIGPDLVVQGDPTLLRAALENLLSNAWKFTGRAEQARIEFGMELQGDGSPVFFVRDNGVGFDMSNAEQLFQPFQRLHPANEFPGTGVGLATVRRIIQRHGGRIWAVSAPGQGATFYFTLSQSGGI